MTIHQILLDANEPPSLEGAFIESKLPFKKIQIQFGNGTRACDITNDAFQFAIERKTTADLISSIKSGRIYDQMDKMNAFFTCNKILLIEGNVKTAAERFPSMRNFIYSIRGDAINRGFSIVETKDVYDTVEAVKWINAKIGTETKPILRSEPLAMEGADARLASLCAIMGLGADRAVSLSKKYATLKAIVNCTEKELQEVEFIGKVMAKRIYDHFNGSIDYGLFNKKRDKLDSTVVGDNST